MDASLLLTRLNGALMQGREQFDRLSGIARRTTPVNAEWRKLRYKIFDLPRAAGPFAERTARATTLRGTAGTPGAWVLCC